MALLIPLVLTLAIIGLMIFINFRQSRKRMYELADLLPSTNEIPLLGNAHQFAGNTKDIFSNILEVCMLTNTKNGVIRQWLGPILYVALTNADDIETILNNALDKDAAYRFMDSWLGKGLINSDVASWKLHRKFLNPTFNQKIIENFVHIFSKQATKLTEKLESRAGNGPFDMLEYVTPCILDILYETTAGVEMGLQENHDSSFVKASISQMNSITTRMVQVWMHPNWIYRLTPSYRQEKENLKTLHAFTDKAVQKKRQELLNNNRDGEDSIPDFSGEGSLLRTTTKAFLDHIIKLREKNDKWTDKELREEVDMMTVAGNDTSSVATSYVMMMLGKYKDVQEKIYDELYEIFGDSDRPADKDDLPKMENLERAIKETLRLLPAVPIVVRKLTKELKIRNYTLPAGAGVVCGIIGLHRDKNVWGDDVLEFDPDRFLPERSVGRKPNVFLPFSAGPRNCIGSKYAIMSMKTFLSTVLRKYKIHSDYDHTNIIVRYAISIKPVGGMILSLEKRKS